VSTFDAAVAAVCEVDFTGVLTCANALTAAVLDFEPVF
jgi:hypothetical protein